MQKPLSKQRVIAYGIIFLAIAIGFLSTLTRIWHTPAPSIEECYQGKELALISVPAPSGAAFFLGDDEANYLRGADQLARGETVTDFNGAMISAVSAVPFDGEKARLFPPYGIAYQLGKDSPPNKPLFISYRSVVFPLLGAPILRITGCNTLGLKLLRYETAIFRGLLILTTALLTYAIASQFKIIASIFVSILVACDSQLNDAAAFFMADVPGVALFFLALVGLLSLRKRSGFSAAMGVGALAAIAVLMKFDFLYVFPIILLVSVLSVEKSTRTHYFRQASIVLLTYLLVIGAYMQRNHTLTGVWFVTSKDSVNLYIGNSIDAPARKFRYGMSDADNGLLTRIPIENAKELGEYGPEIAMRSFFKKQVIDIVVNEPHRVFSMFKQKFVIFLNSGEVVHYPLLGTFSHMLSFAIMAFAVVASPFFLWISDRNKWIGAIVPICFLVILTMVSLVFFEPRFMTHLFPLASIISTVSIFNILGSARSRIGRVKVAA